MTQRPNLLVVFADQWRGSAVGFRDDQIITPNIDAFTKSSFYTDYAITGCPLCSPYRGELLTGRHTASTGIYGNCMTGYTFSLDENEVCMSDILKQEGYRTGYIGKWHLDQPESNYSKHPESGAEGWDAFTPNGKKDMDLIIGMRITLPITTCISIIGIIRLKKYTHQTGLQFMKPIKQLNL